MQLIADALDELPDRAPDSIDCNSGQYSPHAYTYVTPLPPASGRDVMCDGDGHPSGREDCGDRDVSAV